MLLEEVSQILYRREILTSREEGRKMVNGDVTQWRI